MREGKTPIARCADKGKYETLAEIDKPGTRVIINPGGTNERFARAHVRNAEIRVFDDNTKIFDEIAKGDADLMMTDASETRYQQKLASRRALRGASRQAVRLRREGLLDAARRRAQGIRRPVARTSCARTAPTRRSTPPGSNSCARSVAPRAAKN